VTAAADQTATPESIAQSVQAPRDEQAPRDVVPTFTPTPVVAGPTPLSTQPPLTGTESSEPTPTTARVPAPAPTSTPVRTGAIIEVAYMDTYSADAIDGMVARFYPTDNQTPARYAIERYHMRFETTNELGAIVSIRAEIYVPRADNPVLFPLFVYGAGTTGIGNDCAPLDEVARNRSWGNYRTHMLSYAAQGYIGVLPLWQGYDDLTRTHPYFISELEGYIMLDATRAAYNFFRQPAAANLNARPLNAVFYGGYSQGAHGAFAADKMASWYAPELPIQGIIGHASAPSVEALMRERPSLSPYIIYAFRDYYGPDIIDPADVFLPRWVDTFQKDASSKCVDEAYGYYSSDPRQMYRPEFLDILFNDRLGEEYPIFKQALDTNYAGTWANLQTPALILHGETDPIVTPQTAEAFIAQLCRLGKNVTYNLYPDANHFLTRQHSFVDTLTWMRAILNGETPRSDCAAYGG